MQGGICFRLWLGLGGHMHGGDLERIFGKLCEDRG